MKVLITGATGLIGKRLCEYLAHFSDLKITALTRRPVMTYHSNISYRHVDFEGDDLSAIIKGTDCLIHLAGRAHRFEKNDHLKHFQDNFLFTTKMAELSRQNGVKKFIYLSTLKIPRISTFGWQFADFQAAIKNNDCYGLSKKMAEDYLAGMNDVDFATMVIRPPLVYGPHARANFRSLVKLCKSSLPLPFQNVHNARSFIFIDNLVYFIKECMDFKRPQIGQRIYEISDGENVSTSRLVKTIRESLGKNDLQFSVPGKAVKVVLRVFHQKDLYEKLWGNLVVDGKNYTEDFSSLKLPYTFDQGIKITLQKMKAPNERQHLS